MNYRVASVAALLVLNGLALGLGVPAAYATSCGPGQFCGNVYYTGIGCCVYKASFLYDSTAHSLTFTPSLLTGSMPFGSDGIIFDQSTHNLMVGVNCGGAPFITEVDPSTGAVTGTISTPGVSPSHLMADVAGNAWYSADGCGSANQGKVAFGSPTGTAVSMTGDDTFVNTLAWNSITSNENLAYYTSGGCCGGFGHFGTINLATSPPTTTCVKSGGVCEVFPGAHGEFFDSFTGDVIIVGADHITQVDPTTLAVVSDLTVPGTVFDQGSADGSGHLFVANNGGSIYFLDYSTSHLVNSPLNFADNIGGVGAADDVAPLIGPGSSVTGVPQFPLGILGVLVLALPLMAAVKMRASRKLPP